ncbi:SDR family oxidoreductase [Amycolatopsis sp. H20-H5]|uniref:SDR family oxidoreductase n=1 Tax=Amycolatopsis sp. H20-H5 TaxID=3046309 RepID=UPI002DBF3659|nr:SDR family oxidoreductase [Amycolatopsis sp. H20-H5]MEC3975528.1 SDR family oxidoreductase [Amycolatopsis sp. H20-H5]
MMGKTVLVTGASRGVGAKVATLLAKAKANVVINYRQRAKLAERTSASATALGGTVMTVQADLTDADAVRSMFDKTADAFGKLDALILNASGGLEEGKPADYVTRLNVEGQVRAVDLATPLMPDGGRIIFVTSHEAHFYGRRSTLKAYEPVAASKRAGEDALRARIPVLADQGISLVVVSGDVIDRTVTAVLLERKYPGLLARRRAQVGELLTVDDFASAVADVAAGALPPSGTTLFVGSPDAPDV